MFDICLLRYYHLWENARERLGSWTKEGKLQVILCYQSQ